ncbi:hypothetical protein ANO14919_016940 [Xylariales sp. No.14919]|nr:hypothetical protein ANO14919_016940 [Xylariales sp. No.14919]
MTSSENVASSSETATSDDMTHSEAPQSTSRRDSLTSSEQAKPPIPDRLPLGESLGWTGAATIFGGSILISASIGFLSLLWFGYGDRPEAASAPWIWRQIAVHDWMTRTSE